jgi:hypothetical protein
LMGAVSYKVYECVGWTWVVGYVWGLSVGQKYRLTVSAELDGADCQRYPAK